MSLAAAAGGGAQFVAPDGHTFMVYPFTARILATIDEEALRCYKRERMRTLRENRDLYGATPEEQDAALRKEAERLADVMVEDLPYKSVPWPEVVEVDDGAGGKKTERRVGSRRVSFVSWWLMQNQEGTALSCWLACQRGDQNLTREAFESHFEGNAKAIQDLSMLVAELNTSRLKKKE
jgi:hypothetical protein